MIMNAVETPKAVLCTHAGAWKATRDQVFAANPVFDKSATYEPIGHGPFVTMVEERLKHAGWKVQNSAFALSKEGEGQLFGTYDLVPQDSKAQHTLCLGIRNSTDKSLQAGLACGSRVFVCDNLAFSSDVVIQRKHNAKILDILPSLIDEGLGKFLIEGEKQEKEFAWWKSHTIEIADATDAICRATQDKFVLSERLIMKVREEFIKPRFEEFNERNVWGLYNAFTTIQRHERKDVEAGNQMGALRLTHEFFQKAFPMPEAASAN